MIISNDYRYKNRAKLIYSTINEHDITLSREFSYFDCRDYEPFTEEIIDDGGRKKTLLKGKIETLANLDFHTEDYVEIYGRRYIIEGVLTQDNDNQKRLVKSPRKTTILSLRA